MKEFVSIATDISILSSYDTFYTMLITRVVQIIWCGKAHEKITDGSWSVDLRESKEMMLQVTNKPIFEQTHWRSIGKSHLSNKGRCDGDICWETSCYLEVVEFEDKVKWSLCNEKWDWLLSWFERMNATWRQANISLLTDLHKVSVHINNHFHFLWIFVQNIDM